MKVVEPLKDKSVEEALKEFSRHDFRAVVLIGLVEGTPILRVSKCNQQEKAFLLAFFQAYLNSTFGLEEL